MYLYIYMVTTNGFCNFLGNQHWPLMNTENDYRLVLKFSWKSALITDENTQSLKIGSVIFLEISTDPPKESTVCFFLNQHFSETKVTTDRFCKILLEISTDQPWTPKMTTNRFWFFLANQHLAPWAHQITTN